MNFDNLLTLQQIDPITALTVMSVSSVLGFIAWYSYYLNIKDYSYDQNLSFSLIFIAVIISSIILTLGTNIALSLGLIGSLSIIRFRNAVKSSIELSYIFWAISIGLATGSENYSVALVMTAFLFFLSKVINLSKIINKTNRNYTLIITLKKGSSLDTTLKHLETNKVGYELVNLNNMSEATEAIINIKNINTDKKISEFQKLISNYKHIESYSISKANTITTL